MGDLVYLATKKVCYRDTMFAVAYTRTRRSHGGMPQTSRRSDNLTEAQRLGMALRSVRRRLDLSQSAAAERANTHQQTWQRYEAGDNDALLKGTLQRRLVEAIGANYEEFMLEAAKFSAPPASRTPQTGDTLPRGIELQVAGHVAVAENSQPFEDFLPETIDLSTLLGADARVLRLAGESMVPYAEPGGFVTFNLRRYPRRHQGCVIELKNGQFHVKRYERVVDGVLHVTELHPVEREITFPMEEVKGLYAVGLRGD